MEQLQAPSMLGTDLAHGFVAVLGFAIFAFCGWNVYGGVRSGAIELIFSRSWTPLFHRRQQPWAFWTSVFWNALLGLGGLYGGVQIVLGF